MPDEDGNFSLEEINEAMLELPEPEPGRWQLVGQTMLRVGHRFKIGAHKQQPELTGTVMEVGESEATVHVDGEEEPVSINTNHLMATREYLVQHKKEGAIISSAISVAIAGLYVWHRSRKHR